MASEQFVFHHSVNDKTPIYSLRYERILAHQSYDEGTVELSPKQLISLNSIYEAMHQEMNLLRIIGTSWDGGRVIVWRTWINTSDEAHLVATVHDISGSGPSDIAVSPSQACPDKDILIDVHLNILEDREGYPTLHVGFSGKASAWLTTELTLMMLEVPPLEGQGTNRGRERTRSILIPPSVGLEHHGKVMQLYLDDSRGRAILAMQDKTLIVFELA